MGKRLEQTHLYRCGRQAYLKTFYITPHQKCINQNHSEVSLGCVDVLSHG